jgi:integrase
MAGPRPAEVCPRGWVGSGPPGRAAPHPQRKPKNSRAALAKAASPAEWRPVLLFAVLTGMRCGEIRALDRSDVVLEEPAHAIVWRSHGGATKTRRARVAWLVPRAAALVTVSEGKVFRTCRRTPRRPSSTRRRLFRDSFHRLRHTTTAHLRSAGVSDALIGEQLGQSQAKTTRGYGDDGGRALREGLSRVAARWSPPNGDQPGDQPERNLQEATP